MLQAFQKALPVKFIAFYSPQTLEWSSEFFQMIWQPGPESDPRFLFVPPGKRVRRPGPDALCLLFQSPLLAASEQVASLPGPVAVPASAYAQSLLQLIASLCGQPFSALWHARFSAFIAALVPELAEQLERGSVRAPVVSLPASAPAASLSADAPQPPQPPQPSAAARANTSASAAPPSADAARPRAGKARADGSKPIVLINGRPVIYAVRYMKRNMSNPQLSLHDIAQAIGYHPNYFCQEFSRIFSQSPIRFLNELRLQKTLRLLEQTEHTVKAICKMVGVTDSSRLCSMVKNASGMTPMAFRRASRLKMTPTGAVAWQKSYS